MRDLVIWLQAIDIARLSGGALLVSRDGVHTGALGNEEARAVGLTRIGRVDDVVEYLEVRTPAGREFEALLTAAWSELAAVDGRLPKDLVLRSVRNTIFREGELARATIRADAPNGETLTADVTIALDTKRGESSVQLESTKIGSAEVGRIAVSTRGISAREIADYEERLARLRETLTT